MTVVLALIGAVFTGAALWVGYQQMQIARVKLHHDLYDRRYRVYDATRQFLGDIHTEGVTSTEKLMKYAVDIADAVFLFNDDVVQFLRKVGLRGAKVDVLMIAAEQPTRKFKLEDFERIVNERYPELVGMLDELVPHFQPFLTYPEIRTFPLWLERLWRKLRPG